MQQKLVRKIDFRIMIWAWLMFFSLDLDRTNISQANTDNFLQDLHMTTDDFNLGNTLFKVRSSSSTAPCPETMFAGMLPHRGTAVPAGIEACRCVKTVTFASRSFSQISRSRSLGP